MIEINEGRTGNYFVYGVGVIILSFIFIGIGFVGSILFLIIGIAFFVLAILMFLATNGLEISKNEFRKYSSIGGAKIGKCHAFIRPESVILRMHAENGSKEFGSSLVAYVPTMNTKVVTYDIILIDELEKKTLVYEFLEYKKAKLALKEISKFFDIPFKNSIAEQMTRNKRKRRR